MTLHLVALPHTRVTDEFVGCAYTAKALKFTKMMGRFEDVVLYAPEGSTTEHTAETVEVVSDNWRRRKFGKDDPNRLPSWPSEAQTLTFSKRTAKELRRRVEPGDLVLLTGGYTHHEVKDRGPDAIYCEPGVGYEGIFTDFCAFESHAWRHTVYAKRGMNDGRWFDTVIPNYFDTAEFAPLDTPPTRDYLAFLGRLVPRKGPQVALEIATASGIPLRVAGAGAEEVTEGRIVAGRGTWDQVILEGDVSHVGPVNAEQRREFLSNAKALLVPTTYIEPFGGVAVEAMLCGTPVIATDWGAFTETVIPWETGFRFATLQEGVEAVAKVGMIPPSTIRAAATLRYSLPAVGMQFLEWFARLRTLHGKGWYEMSSPRAKISA